MARDTIYNKTFQALKDAIRYETPMGWLQQKKERHPVLYEIAFFVSALCVAVIAAAVITKML